MLSKWISIGSSPHGHDQTEQTLLPFAASSSPYNLEQMSEHPIDVEGECGDKATHELDEANKSMIPFMRQRSDMGRDVGGSLSESVSAEALVKRIVPTCASAVITRMRREGITTVADLAGLDKEDLRMLGFSMVERSRLQRWVGGDSNAQEVNTNDPANSTSPKHVTISIDSGLPEDPVQQRLDEVEQQADFWMDLVSSATSTSGLRSAHGADLKDVRENMLEMLFDLTEEHVKEVYNGIDRDADGHITAAELAKGLQRYNLPVLNDKALARVLDVVTASKSRFLQLPEFEAVLSRLKLAQILLGSDGGQSPLKPFRHLLVADYTALSTTANIMQVTRPREFFFGHRPQAPLGGTLVRWIHQDGLDMSMVLALTVKYSLHPLSVEDVLEQAPTKIDRNGRNYFVAIEHMGLTSCADGSAPVRVRGRHVAMFCAGPPRLDTLITIAQPDKSFVEEWPGGVTYFDAMDTGDRWVDRLQERLKAPLSRLRERLADFMLYQVIDLCTDELVTITRAYTKRLGMLEVQLGRGAADLTQDWSSEVSLARLQLTFLVRRVRGLQRVIRHIIQDTDLSAGLSSYFQDVADHLNEAHDDAAQLAERCTAIADMFERQIERGQERIRQLTAERLNRTLFVLTTFTTVFAPMQFMAGVYGMNFQDSHGKSTMPELNHQHGYIYFWVAVMSYLLLSIGLAWLIFRRLQRSDARARGQCQGPFMLCGNGYLCGGDRSQDIAISCVQSDDGKIKVRGGGLCCSCCIC
mmetsp:Transcript_12449/g.20412  ORF Transcript_12449/g.20412 Transcript_12449/m.20412 type:complete len:753 (-) Transcript_12449:141-2399(-)